MELQESGSVLSHSKRNTTVSNTRDGLLLQAPK